MNQRISAGPAIDLAVDQFGSSRAFADALGVAPSAVSNWRRRGVPALQARKIEKITGGKVKRSQLRPDLFRG